MNETTSETLPLESRNASVGVTGEYRDATPDPAPQLVALPEGAHACPSCGIATEPHPADPPDKIPMYRESARGAQRVGEAILTRCADCRRAHELALRLLDSPEGMRARRGLGDAQAEAAAEGALAALAALGRPVRAEPADLRLLIRHLAQIGNAARFATSPRVAEAAAEPWAHLTAEKRQLLRDAYAQWCAARVTPEGPPEILTPPPAPRLAADVLPVEGACLLCGVGSVTVTGRQVERHGGTEPARRGVWTPRASMSAASMGSKPSPLGLAGHTCPPCSGAIADNGAAGPGAIEAAIIQHYAATISPDWGRKVRNAIAELRGRTVPGMVAFGALAHRAHCRRAPMPEPNPRPWAHIEIDVSPLPKTPRGGWHGRKPRRRGEAA